MIGMFSTLAVLFFLVKLLLLKASINKAQKKAKNESYGGNNTLGTIGKRMIGTHHVAYMDDGGL